MSPPRAGHRDKDVLLVLRAPRCLALPPVEVLQVIREATAAAASHLTILLPVGLPVERPAAVFAGVQRLLSSIYTEAGRELTRRDDLLLPVDVLIDDLSLRCGGERYQRSGHTQTFEAQWQGDDTGDPTSEAGPVDALYGTTAMGGTFDHLHNGHKVLLTMAAWISRQRVIVGITDNVLLEKKANKQLLEPLTERSAHARDFMHLIAPSLQIDTPALQDVYGPTAWDPDVHACVVSAESIKGARAIDAERTRNGLPALRTFIIDVIAPETESPEPAERERLKLGSTAIRAWLASRSDGASPGLSA